MNIKKFKKEVSKEQYIVVIDFYDVNGEIDNSKYITCTDYSEAINFLTWAFNSCESAVIDEYVDNPKKYNNRKREKDEFEFKFYNDSGEAYIYDSEYELYMHKFHIEKLENSSKYVSQGWTRD